jgi:hypothetical protein
LSLPVAAVVAETSVVVAAQAVMLRLPLAQ